MYVCVLYMFCNCYFILFQPTGLVYPKTTSVAQGCAYHQQKSVMVILTVVISLMKLVATLLLAQKTNFDVLISA